MTTLFKSLLRHFLTFVVQLHRFGNNNALKRLIYSRSDIVDVIKRNRTVLFVDSQGLTDKTEQFGEQ